ncbi:MAG: HDIG domain-containing protein [Deltaproteobacteria bacterium]|nr:HDIG domain-containing protein [Deltaproteobacteria bacterium]
MAKAEAKPRAAPQRRGILGGLEVRPSGPVLLASALAGCLLLSALLTLEVAPTSSAGRGGRPIAVGDISERDEKAPTAITVSDPQATEKLRREAVEKSPTVYDFDENRASALRESIAKAFAAARAALAQAPPKPVDESALRSPAAVFVETLGGKAPVPEPSLRHLEKSGFPVDDERIVAQLVESVSARMIVDETAEFERHVQAGTVLVRDLGSGNERALKSPQRVLSAEGVREQLERSSEAVLSGAPPATRAALLPLAQALVRPNLNFNLRATDERRKAAEASVKEATISLRKGEIIVRDGDPITERHVLILEGIRAQQSTLSQLSVFAGVAILLLLLMRVVWRFGATSLLRFPRRTKDAWFLLTTLVATALGTSIGLFLSDTLGDSPRLQPLVEQWPNVLLLALPIAAGTMLVRMVHSAETAALFAVLVSLVTGFQVHGDLGFAIYALVGSLTAAVGAARVTQRGTLLRAGLRVGLANSVVAVALLLLGNHFSPLVGILAVSLSLLSGALCGVLVSGLAPLVESVFSYTTAIKLLELANREQSLLRDLELRAPGTYHHSMMVGHLAEMAAEEIGANALLAKVAGYYHDIGKMRRPQFFVENVAVTQGENRHEKLSPSMSARIIQAHVKDGVEMAEKEKLALPIRQGIAEHHGTSVIRFFYEKAKELADPEKGDLVAEHDYRYHGPKPQTREAGILMLADSVEAASRTLVDTSPARVQQLVQRIINNYFRDGQLDDCSLTLRDLHSIARSFIETLSAIRHERIDYPAATDAFGRRMEEGGDEGPSEREPRSGGRSEGAREKREDDLRRLGLD